MLIKIGDFSKICRVPVSALRYYADLGLLEPAEIDLFTGYRYYTLDQLPRLNRILALKDLGLSLQQIAETLNGGLSAAELRGMLKLKQGEIADQIREEQARLARVKTRIQLIEMEGEMPEQEVILKLIERMHTLSLREVVPDTERIGTIWNETWREVSQRGIQPVAPCLSIYYHEEFTPTNIDMEFVFPVAPEVKEPIPLAGNRQLVTHDLPAVTQATRIIHKGEYDSLNVSYEIIGRWINMNGYRVVAPAREIYLKMDGANSVTEIQFPVEK